jgi:hypothetical protein
MLVLALALVIGIACALLIFIQFRRFEEQHESSSHLLKTQTELEIAKKALAGYTKADDYLAQAHKKLVEQAPSFGVSVTREHVHQERFHKDQDKLKADASLLVRYAVTYNYLVDLNAASFVLARETPGIRIRVAPPALQGMPSVKIMSHEVSPPGGLPDERAALAQVQQKLSALKLRMQLPYAAHGHAGGGGAGLHAQLGKHPLQVLFDGGRAGAHDVANVAVDLALDHASGVCHISRRRWRAR